MKRLTALVVMMAMLASASFALADVTVDQNVDQDVNVDQTVTNTNTLQQTQGQQQGQETNVSTPIVAPAGAAGVYVNAGTAYEETMYLERYDELYLGEYTREELEKALDDSDPGSFWDHKGGFFESFSSRVKSNLAKIGPPVDRIRVYGRSQLHSGDKIRGGSVKVMGDYDWTMDVSFYAASLFAMDYGHSSVVVDITRRTMVKNRAYNGGIGVSMSSGSSCTGVSTGINVGKTVAETYTAFDSVVKAVVIGKCEPKPPVTETCPPEEKPCVTCELKQISSTEEAEAELTKVRRDIHRCLTFCNCNLCLRLKAGYYKSALGAFTGNKKYFRDAIEDFEIAERNYQKGHDIREHQAEADQAIAQVYYYWAGCIYETRGDKAAAAFAEKHNLERYPAGFTH